MRPKDKIAIITVDVTDRDQVDAMVAAVNAV